MNIKCPHCLTSIILPTARQGLIQDGEGLYSTDSGVCPACNKGVIYLIKSENRVNVWVEIDRYLVKPKGVSRTPLSKDVPNAFASDYKEACLVLSDSPKASAALSRRCLQNILHNKLNINHGNLSREIQEVIDNKLFSSDILEAIDAIRAIGNFAAHPLKETNTGDIVDVEPGEAEWNLDVIEQIFDYLFVAPAVIQKKKVELNKKLAAAGKPPMK